MAKIVTIDTGTHNPVVNEIGDIVSIYDDNVSLGVAYATFKIINLPGLSVTEAEAALGNRAPNMKRIYKSVTVSGEWSFEEPDQSDSWQDVNGRWFLVNKTPKYTQSITTSMIDSLTKAKTKVELNNILTTVEQKITTETSNQTIIPEL